MARDALRPVTSAGVLVFALSACQPGPGAGEQSGAGDASDLVERASEFSESSAGWVPENPIEHPQYTEEERLEWRGMYLERVRNQNELESVPEVPLVRWSTTMAEYRQNMNDCRTEAGFPSVIDATGDTFFEPGVPESQELALNAADYVCQAQYTPIPAIGTDYSEDQVGLLWDYWTEAYVPCLEGHGIAAPTNIPSRESFVADFYGSTEEQWWAPHLVPLEWSQDRIREVYKDCPSYPPTEYFYGS